MSLPNVFRFPARRLSALAVFALLNSALAGSGGNGVRNGGSGVLCDGWDAPRVVERFFNPLPTPLGALGADALRAVLLDDLRKIDPEFAFEIALRLTSFGPYSEWPIDCARYGGLASGYPWEWPRAPRHPVEQFLSTLRYEYRDFRWPTGWDDSRTFDDLLDFQLLPEGCRYVQLAAYDGRAAGLGDARPRRTYRYRDRLAGTDRALLELHEAVYSYGATAFGHESSVPTRNLISALIRDHGRFERNGSAADELARFRDYRRIFRRATSAVPENLFRGYRTAMPFCPRNVLLQYSVDREAFYVGVTPDLLDGPHVRVESGHLPIESLPAWLAKCGYQPEDFPGGAEIVPVCPGGAP